MTENCNPKELTTRFLLQLLKNSPQGFCYNYCKCLHFCWLLY